MISGKARLAGVMGWPVSHSLSPRMHNHWLEQYGIDGAYVPLAVAPEHLAEAVRALPKLGFAGWNVTLPHKEAMLRLVDELDPLARSVGAVNTVIVQKNGRLLGKNTDVYGFIENLNRQQPEWKRDGKAVILGAGGAARGVVAGLKQEGVSNILLTNRTREKAEALATEMKTDVLDWQEKESALTECDLLVNTTSLGMQGQAPLELSLEAFPKTGIACDIVYTPLMTPLLQAAQVRGNRIVTGLGMLMHQAVPGFSAWFGSEPNVDNTLEQLLLQQLGEAR